MASISREPNGWRTVQFVAGDGKRRSIRLGKVSQRDAETFKLRVELLLVAQLAGQAIDADTARWVASRPQEIADKLAKVGLIAPRTERVLADPLRCTTIPGRAGLTGHTQSLPAVAHASPAPCGCGRSSWICRALRRRASAETAHRRVARGRRLRR
ncbi:MAG: hypothetical protein WD894_11920 [Pirellulales bacterium]